MNALSLIISSLGLLVGATALGFAYYQVRKIRRVAEAARDASARTETRLASMEALVGLTRSCSISSDLIMLLRENNLQAARIRAFDLREQLSSVRTSKEGSGILHPSSWQTILTELGRIHDELEASAMSGPSPDPGLRNTRISRVNKIHETLTSLKQKASERAGNDHV